VVAKVVRSLEHQTFGLHHDNQSILIYDARADRRAVRWIMDIEGPFEVFDEHLAAY
jgi:hypothetical protein